ncbi:MAG: hypothetical protein A2Y42_00535 [Omnitrophica WOR_2 bacterium GWB2_45_9]|nr:MAG: hypothetical protein A2Y42_00535 [Omnitrophica WOR_2 bacterium GWB2_45_9]OGX47382.1 MAG: hypothetical protein A2216_00960 [Omnitrophica WOR_2 bacterium RIFOXYA2_FULL_45_12]OGX54374.1 MAG: hypothetical protein A2321_04250 [Omnitrophica WOR_2 bacterium RIFOXYB2_FULL_45_11]OGX60695.1 MAG: hypothetical protein A2471_03270 [Omnitrophica WOR_2 bacterium RIFOXYC2_FULL_45_15]
MVKKFFLYVFRWQLSTPILWLVVHKLGVGLSATVIANLIGAGIFFWVDIFIFGARKNKKSGDIELWHLKEDGSCASCGKKDSLWRLVKTANYDRSSSKAVFLCPDCSQEKLTELKSKGIETAYQQVR